MERRVLIVTLRAQSPRDLETKGSPKIERMWSSPSPFDRSLNRQLTQKCPLNQIERELDMERTVFYIQHRIKIAADLPDHMASDWKQRVDSERVLLRSLDEVIRIVYFEKHMDLEKFANTTICFGKKSGIDLLGRIGLKIGESKAQWVEQLLSVDRERIDAIKDGSADRFDLEKSLSDSLGLDYVYTDYELGASKQYADFLEKVQRAVAETKTVMAGMECLKLRIFEANEIKTDSATCTVSVPVTMAAEDVLQAIRVHGPELVRIYVETSRAEADLSSLVLSAKRKFRLRSLSWDPAVSNSQFQTCVTAIIRYAAHLSRFLEGQRLLVAQDFNVDPTDGTIHIRWDFMI